ncbi:hypothetical protein F441_10108 [Phytophthora nicotianae CJ01A1]|uniref:Uncharacterized protein n=1 Tax=Phytophthora nicotianae CJ01A1 TaxID=1317063 RepID=W2WZH1_PHYNI|nr:hypothetical protein F441_10108 [Phytophthora nicotianae CJ01A1]
MASCTLEKVTQGGELGEIHQQPIYDGHVRIELHMACPKLAAFITAHRERQDVSFVAGGSVHSSRKARGFLNFAADVRHSKLSAAALRLEFVKLKSRKGIRPFQRHASNEAVRRLGEAAYHDDGRRRTFAADSALIEDRPVRPLRKSARKSDGCFMNFR